MNRRRAVRERCARRARAKSRAAMYAARFDALPRAPLPLFGTLAVIDPPRLRDIPRPWYERLWRAIRRFAWGDMADHYRAGKAGW